MKQSMFVSAIAALLLAPVVASAAPITVQSTDSVYNYSGAQVAGASSTTPQQVSVAAYGGKTITFSTTGLVGLTPASVGPPFGQYGPDGGPDLSVSYPSLVMNVSAAAGLSGVHSNNVGYLAGVFINGAEGATTSLPVSDFSGPSGESFASLSPLVDQVFFIGDGLTGTGSGAVQSFFVPTGATELVLGIVDANGYNGVPGAYFDNSGSYAVTVNLPSVGGVPEPASWGLMILGLGAAGATLRRRKPVSSLA